MSEVALLIQNLVGGISIGSIYALVALGYALVYRAMGLVNFAHGSIFMIGTYLGIIFYMGMAGVRLPFALAFVVGVALAALFGILLERVFRPLARLDPMFMLIGTIGVGIMLDNLAIVIWGAEGFAVPAPIPNQPVRVGGVVLLPYNFVMLAAAAVLMLGLQWFLTRTRTGKAMRASAQDREVAAAMGVPVNLMNALTFAIGSGLAAAAGILAAPVLYVNPALSAVVGIKGFAATILGGFGNLPGAIVGGLVFGIIESVTTGYLSSAWKQAIAFVILTLVLMVKPSGLIGEKTVEKV